MGIVIECFWAFPCKYSFDMLEIILGNTPLLVSSLHAQKSFWNYILAILPSLVCNKQAFHVIDF